MEHHDFHSVALVKMFCQLLRKIDRAVLPTRAAERNHQILEAALLIGAHAAINQRHHAGKILMHALLLVEVIDYRRVFSGESFEAFFPPGIGQAAAIENKAAAISTFIFRKAAVKREAEDAHDKIVGFGGDALQLRGGQHVSGKLPTKSATQPEA